ncbi:immunoglobulin-like domain-containing protein [Paenibacillus hexagrammi]|uniref:Cohesin domain-containing protein n=1 Tax=Paenibacillus hexagrammi TaxID=2908839 RepID=A0ABY3SQ52_9BACL|nr:immunoglobulin-like domain-containing protein [Paenibacillus sp. YPD9-1]UJF35191.1 cohesin domain-containing protein [Paenibacillus sp. YPD9-1]
MDSDSGHGHRRIQPSMPAKDLASIYEDALLASLNSASHREEAMDVKGGVEPMRGPLIRRIFLKILLPSCFALLVCLIPILSAQAATDDLVNVATADHLIVTFNKENPPSETADKLFDSSPNTKWLGAQPTNVWVQLQFKYGDTQAVQKYAMVSANDAQTRDPQNWRVEGSNDGSNWTVLDEQTNQSFSARFQTKEYTIADEKVAEYAYYRLFILSNSGERVNTQLADWKLYAPALDDASSVKTAIDSLDLGDTSALSHGVTLPVNFKKGTTITWVSSKPSVMNNAGKLLRRPGLGEPNEQLTLTATVQKGSERETKQFPITVLAMTAADSTYEAGVDFETGFESGDISPKDTAGPADTYRVLPLTKNVGEFCCGIGGMESKKGSAAHNGAGALLFSGDALNSAEAHAYNQIFDAELMIRPSTTLSYWVFPEKESDVLPSLERTTSKYVALDILFTDGTYLHDLGAKDQHGVTLHPNVQGAGGFIIEDQWNYVSANIGEVANGKFVDQILLGFDAGGAEPGYFRGSFDDITIEHDSSAGESNTRAVKAAKEELNLGDTSAVSYDLSLPTSGAQQTIISWQSSNPEILSAAGELLSRPNPGESSAAVDLTATIGKGDSFAVKMFHILVLPLTRAEAVDMDAAHLQITHVTAVADDILLPIRGEHGTSITWESANPAVLSGTGQVSRPGQDQPDAEVTLIATITSGASSLTKSFSVVVVAHGNKGDVRADTAELHLGDSATVTNNVYLPKSGRFGSTMIWESTNDSVVSSTGIVHRPGVGQPDESVKLTAILTKGEESQTKEFMLLVKAMNDNEVKVLQAAEALDLGDTSAVTKNLTLPNFVPGIPDVMITWASSDSSVVDFHGNVVLPCPGEPDVTVALIASIQSGNERLTKWFTVTVKALRDANSENDDASLSEIMVDGQQIDGFSADVRTYTLELPEGTTNVPVVSAAANDPHAEVEIIQASGLPGEADITVTAEDGVTKLTYKVHFKLNGAPESVEAVLQGADQVNSGVSFDLIYDLKSVTQSVYAQDLTFTYDPKKVELLSVNSAKAGVEIVDQRESTGQIRVLLARIEENEEASSPSEGLLVLNWKAKSLTSNAQTEISLSNAVIAGGTGDEIPLSPVSHTVLIQYVNKTSLLSLLAKAQQTYDAAVEGNGAGQYPAGSKAALQNTILGAQAAADDAQSSQVEIDQAEDKLYTALQEFLASVHTKNPGDLNEDDSFSIGDLAIMASFYGKTSNDPNWSMYMKADLNHDGLIDITDLAVMASKIIN